MMSIRRLATEAVKFFACFPRGSAHGPPFFAFLNLLSGHSSDEASFRCLNFKIFVTFIFFGCTSLRMTITMLVLVFER